MIGCVLWCYWVLSQYRLILCIPLAMGTQGCLLPSILERFSCKLCGPKNSLLAGCVIVHQRNLYLFKLNVWSYHEILCVLQMDVRQYIKSILMYFMGSWWKSISLGYGASYCILFKISTFCDIKDLKRFCFYNIIFAV